LVVILLEKVNLIFFSGEDNNELVIILLVLILSTLILRPLNFNSDYSDYSDYSDNLILVNWKILD
jgi:hypothetical protein